MEKRRHPKNGSGPIPAFARLAALREQCGNKKTTNNFMNFLELLHLAFEGKLAANGGSNVKFAPQARTISAVS